MSEENRAATTLRLLADLIEKGVLDVQATETNHSNEFTHNGHPILSTCKVTIRHELNAKVDPATHLEVLRLFASLLYVPYENASKTLQVVDVSKTPSGIISVAGGTA